MSRPSPTAVRTYRLRPGDKFMWAGHVATLVARERRTVRGRERVRLICEVEGVERRLSYDDNETVELAPAQEVVKP